MWLYILAGVAAVIAVLAIVISMRPTAFNVSRSTKIAASPGAIFPFINNLRKWEAWSPWAKIDPDCKITFSGPEAGPGAHYHWSGNNKVGEGNMTLVDSRANDNVRLKLEFIRPFNATNDVDFSFKSEGGKTGVTWTMAGKNSFMSKAIGLFMDCEKMVAKDFNKGLASLKSVAEAAAV